MVYICRWSVKCDCFVGFQTVPQVFFNDKYIGGINQLEELSKQEKLNQMVKECIESESSPLQLRTPEASEFIQVHINCILSLVLSY